MKNLNNQTKIKLFCSFLDNYRDKLMSNVIGKISCVCPNFSHNGLSGYGTYIHPKGNEIIGFMFIRISMQKCYISIADNKEILLNVRFETITTFLLCAFSILNGS